MANVSTPCAAYTAAAAQWELIDDAAAGSAAVKAKKERYLPRPNPQDKSRENTERYDTYVMRACYYNATGRTLEGLTGLAFAKDPQVEAPQALADVLENLDGAGTTLVQHMHDALAEVVKNGRAGLLADFPRTDGATSRADEQRGGIRPTVTFYPANAVINWRTTVIGGRAKLSLVVLVETHETYDGFENKSEPQYRVLRLDGVYRVEVWRRVQKANSAELEWRIAEGPFMPLGGDGNPLDEIPFTFVGSKNNGVAINKAPLADIAELNVAHYRNSADYEDSAYFCGQPQVYMAGLDETWVKMLDEKGIYFGSRAMLPLPTGGSAGILQAQPNTLAKEAMDAKEKQMAALGARLIAADSSVKTATQQQSEDVVSNSVLSLCCDNVSAAYTRALQWVAMFANAAGKCLVSIHTEFTKFTIAPDELAALIQGVQAGLIPLSDFWARMRTGGVIDPAKTDDDIREEVEATALDSVLGGAGAASEPGNGGAAGNAGAANAG